MSFDVNTELSPVRQFIVALALEPQKGVKNDLALNLGLHPRFVDYFRTSIKTLTSAETSDELKQYQLNIIMKLDFIQQAPNAFFSLLRMAKEANTTYLSLPTEEGRAKQAEEFKKILAENFESAINNCKFVFAMKIFNYNHLFDLIMKIATKKIDTDKQAEVEILKLLPFLQYQRQARDILPISPKSIYLDTSLQYAKAAIDEISSKEEKLSKLPSFDSENTRVAKEGFKMTAVAASILDVPHVWKLVTWTPWAADLVHRQVSQVSFLDRMKNFVTRNKGTVAGGLVGGIALTTVLFFVFPPAAIVTGAFTILSGVYAVSTAVSAYKFAKKELQQRAELTNRTVERLAVQEKADNHLMLTAEKLGVDVSVSNKERAHATNVQKSVPVKDKVKSTLATFKKLFSKDTYKQLSAKKLTIEPEEIEMTSPYERLENSKSYHAPKPSQPSEVQMVEKKSNLAAEPQAEENDKMITPRRYH